MTIASEKEEKLLVVDEVHAPEHSSLILSWPLGRQP